MTVLVDLDDPAARDPQVSGAKAAQLARARGLGLPVLPGVVVPVAASRAAVGAAVDALARGSGAARLAALRAPVDPDLMPALHARATPLGHQLVVRSSSPLEDAPAWSGAFSSFLDIAADDLATAVRGCWASAFAVDPLERAEASSVAPAELTMAVLVQPQLTPDAGGLARTGGDGAVTITAVKGSPAPLLTGWERGVQVQVAPDGTVAGDTALLATTTVSAVAALARRARTELDSDVIEWAVAGGAVTLLQCRRAAPAAGAAPHVPDGLDHPMALRLARLALRFPGPTGQRLVLAWACAGGWQAPAATGGARGAAPGGGAPGGHGAVPEGAKADLLRTAEQRARDLAAIAWDLPPDEAMAAAARTFTEARGPDPAPALRRLAALRDVPAGHAAEVLAQVAAATAGRDRSPAIARDGWEPFVFGAVRAHGERVTGVSAAEGIGAGVLATVTNPHAADIAVDRAVLAAAWPLPGLAPLMWGAAGLVTGAGSPAAHLLEVAHSLRVPAVVGCPIDGWMHAAAAGQRVVAAVDGAAGAVYLTTG